MNKHSQSKIKLTQSLLAVGALTITGAASGGPGILQDVPLSIATFVQPNILYLIDDSGSMDWEILKSSGAQTHYPSNRNSGNLDMTPSYFDQEELLESCALYNVMYYDPSKTYTPWHGVDINGDAYVNMTNTQSYDDPYYANSFAINLSTLSDGNSDVPGYIPFNDTDGDGEFDLGECHDAGTVAQMHDKFIKFTDMSAAQQTNFANWYAYYRKREYVVKRALSEIIDDSTARVGLATLHNNFSVGTLITDVDDVSQPINNTAVANKKALMDSLFQIESSGLTPLRQTLNNAGLYFTEGQSPGTNLFGFEPNHSTIETVSSNSPILNNDKGGSCQQNFSVLFSDGEWNGGAAFGIGNEDGDDDTLFDGGNFADNFSGSLADVAMKYLEDDLSSSLSNSLNVTDIRQTNVPIKHQHMTTYSIAFGVNGSLTNDPNDASFPGWPAPTNFAGKIDDARHTAWNGRGDFLNAQDPDSLIDSLNAAIEDIESRAGTATTVSFNSGSISTDTLVFQSRFSSDNWTGDVLAYRFDNDGVVDTNGDGDISIADAIWSASDKLNSQLTDAGYANRNVITYNGTQGVPFAFPANHQTLLADGNATEDEVISDKLIRDLLSNAPHNADTTDSTEQGENQTFGENIVNYIKGDTSNELTSVGAGLFRARNNKLLGAFVHSSPQFSGAPSEPYPNLIEGVGKEYATYEQDNAARRPLIFVGGNEGMLHAFDATDTSSGGNEVFAYIPSIIANDLHKPSEANYEYKAYVDSSPTLGDVYVNDAWRTYLVGGLRTGGRGIYVLDVSDPTALAAADTSAETAKKIVVNEFTDNNLGFTFSRPQIAKMNNGRWAAIFGNGYNNHPQGDGKARLYVLYLDNGESRSIEASESSVTYLANSDCLDAGSNCNGLSSPSLADLNGDAIVDRVYAGDLHGNLWAFDLSDNDHSKWALAYTNEPLFTACETTTCSLTNRQPITTKPVVSFHPSRHASSTEPNMMIFFGTGQAIAQGDNQNKDLQSFYGIWDAGVNKADGSSNTLTKTNLQQQVFDSTFDVSSETVDFSISSEFGWYVDLKITGNNILDGARSVNTPLLLGDIIFFLISIPDDVVCSGGGLSYLAALNTFDGTRSNFNIFDTDDDGKPDSSSPLTLQDGNVVGIGNIDDKVVTTGSDGLIRDTDVVTKIYIPSGRKSWSIIR